MLLLKSRKYIGILTPFVIVLFFVFIFANSVLSASGTTVNLSSDIDISRSGLISSVPIKQLNSSDNPKNASSAIVLNRYIVELSEQPVSVTYAEIESTRPAPRPSPGPRSMSIDQDTQDALNNQKSKVINQQKSFFANLPLSVKNKNSAVISSISSGDGLKSFDSVINAVVLSMSSSEAGVVKRLASVKNIEPVKSVQTDLMDSVPLIHAPDVWGGNYSGGSSDDPIAGKGIRIAIIDTGVDYKHPDLGGCLGPDCKVFGGYDFVNKDNDPMDDMGHGTHVADISAGNGTPKGVAPDATIYAYKVLDKNGRGTTDNILAGIERTIDPNQDGNLSEHLDVANMSLGGSGDPDDLMSQAVDNAVKAGVVFVVAAGNAGPSASTVLSPGTARNAITVAATDKHDVMASFSSRGPVVWTRNDGTTGYLDKPDVAAPGVDICAARLDTFSGGNTNCNNDSNHIAISGTSMATPHVAGEVALLLQIHPDWSPAEVKAAVKNSTVNQSSCLIGSVLCSSNKYNKYDAGTGRIDAKKLAESSRLPIAQIDPAGDVRGVINFTGSAYSQRSNIKYSLSYGIGDNPNSFTDITSTDQPVKNNVLYANFDTTSLSDGKYTVRLTVTDDDGNISEDSQVMEVNDAEITSVGNNLNYVNGGTYQIHGKIWLRGVSSLKVYADSTNGPALCSVDYTQSDSLCSAGFGNLSDGIHQLFLSVQMPGGSWKTGLGFKIAVVKEMLDGWPKEINSLPRGTQSTIQFSDNENPTLVVPTWGDCVVDTSQCGMPGLNLYQSNGSFSQFKLSDGSQMPFTPGDNLALLKNDSGKKYLVMLNDCSSPNPPENWNCGPMINRVVDKSGNILGSWFESGSITTQPPATVIDNNGKPEIYTLGLDLFSKKIWITGHDSKGEALNNFPIVLPQGDGPEIMFSTHIGLLKNGYQSTLAAIAGNFTNDSGYMKDFKVYFYLYSKDGQLISKTNLFDGTGRSSFQPTIPSFASADFYGDGRTEAVVGLSVWDKDTSTDTAHLYIIDATGKILSSASFDNYDPARFAIGNLMGSKPNIVVAAQGAYVKSLNSAVPDKILVFDESLNKLLEISEQSYNNDNLIQGVSVGDVDNDGKSDIVLDYRPRWYNGSNFGVQIFDNKGGLKQEIKIPTMGTVDDLWGSPAIIDDFNGDGNTDIILQSLYLKNGSEPITEWKTRLYVLDLGTKLNTSKIDWKTVLHDDQHTGCFNCTTSASTTQGLASTSPVITNVADTASKCGDLITIKGAAFSSYNNSVILTEVPNASSTQYLVKTFPSVSSQSKNSTISIVSSRNGNIKSGDYTIIVVNNDLEKTNNISNSLPVTITNVVGSANCPSPTPSSSPGISITLKYISISPEKAAQPKIRSTSILNQIVDGVVNAIGNTVNTIVNNLTGQNSYTSSSATPTPTQRSSSSTSPSPTSQSPTGARLPSPSSSSTVLPTASPSTYSKNYSTQSSVSPNPSKSASPTPTKSASPTPAQSPTPAPTKSSSPTPSPSSTSYSTPTPTGTSSPTPTRSATPTPTPSSSSTVTPTPTATFSTTPAPTSTVTPTPTPKSSSTPSPTPISTPTPTQSNTPSQTQTPSSSPTPTATPTPPVQSSTPTPTPTSTYVPSPTALLTVNGAHNVTLNVSDPINYYWNGTNGTSYSSTYTSNIAWKCGSGGSWIANTLNGNSNSTVPSAAAGCYWTATYTVYNSSTGRSASDYITININPLPTTSPTPSSSSSPSPSSSPNAYRNSNYDLSTILLSLFQPWANLANVIGNLK